MSRLKADFLLLTAAIIWGAAFIAQKNSFAHLGPCAFVFARFFLSALAVAPFAWRETKQVPFATWRGHILPIIITCICFAAGVLTQQAGVGQTSVTNAGFITGLYVIFVPLICSFAFKQKLSPWIAPAALLSLLGVRLLAGGSLSTLGMGDALVFACAAGFGVQVAMLGQLLPRLKTPLALSFLQYAVVAAAALIGMLLFESPSLGDFRAQIWSILYAGLLSGGVAYTLQAVAQQHAPASDCAILLSAESLFAALFAAFLLGERLTGLQYAGGALILLAIVMTEAVPLLMKKKAVPA